MIRSLPTQLVIFVGGLTIEITLTRATKRRKG
jgi:hypothetical protein